MNSSFSPGFKNFQKDIERCLRIEGKCEKNEHGQTVFHGYPKGLDQMFRVYLEHQAFAPLVEEFRKWNWEWGYNDYLLELTAHLRETGNWPLLKELWAGVVAKRRTNHNKTRKAQKAAPERISRELVTKTRILLLDSLFQLRSYAIEFRRESEVAEYLEMIAGVEKLRKA